MSKTRQISWLQLLAQADPDWVKDATNAVEYEFTARGLPIEPTGDYSTHENGQRVFRANPKQRGAYQPEEDVDGGLTWNGQQLVWPTGEALIWDGEDE